MNTRNVQPDNLVQIDQSDDEPLLDIDDPGIPMEIRNHGRQFRNPARFAVDLGQHEYILYAADGELLDLVSLK